MNEAAAAIRPGRDADAQGFIDLIEACWSEYPGTVMDVDREMPELRALASYHRDRGGALWAAEAAGRLVGMIGAYPHDGGSWEISRVYVRREHRGGGLGHRLLDVAEAHARAAGATRLSLWSDTRFDRAHRFYEKRSYVRSGPIRALNDLSNSIEFHYAKPISGIEVLDAAAAASAERRLAEILVACVNAGASVSYLPPLTLDAARAFWHRAAADVAAGTRIMLGAWMNGALAGTVMLDLDTPPNQPHRAEVQKLLVHPAARRAGLAQDLMARLEQQACIAGRTLLTLDTQADSFAETLYRKAGWTEGGRIPQFALNADRELSATVLFYKSV
ncbi:MAG TPA: GNAT family N-acetyltransferase [Acetobacteraceae bacterium]|nr:GNAT family N-acetyltransferase [Acetobacteraceae bacterium]